MTKQGLVGWSADNTYLPNIGSHSASACHQSSRHQAFRVFCLCGRRQLGSRVAFRQCSRHCIGAGPQTVNKSRSRHVCSGCRTRDKSATQSLCTTIRDTRKTVPHPRPLKGRLLGGLEHTHTHTVVRHDHQPSSQFGDLCAVSARRFRKLYLHYHGIGGLCTICDFQALDADRQSFVSEHTKAMTSKQ